jgi:hypothetical protein
MPLSTRRRSRRATLTTRPHNPSKPPAPRLPPLRQPPPRPDRPSRFLFCSLRLSSLSFRLFCLLSRPFLLPTTSVSLSLHQLLPVPGPDPSRAPLWCLGGVRARHRPQTPINTGIECGRAIHTPVHTAIRPCSAPFRPSDSRRLAAGGRLRRLSNRARQSPQAATSNQREPEGPQRGVEHRRHKRHSDGDHGDERHSPVAPCGPPLACSS